MLGCIVIVKIVKLVHLEVKVFKSDVKSDDFFIVNSHITVKSKLLLLEDRFCCLEFVTLSGNAGVGILLLDQVSLVLDPLFLYLCDLVFKLTNLFVNVTSLGFERS